MTDRERKQHALLDRVDDEVRRARTGRLRRLLRTAGWAVAALVPVGLVAWFVDGRLLAEHGFWGGLALCLVVVSGLGVGVGVTGWLRDHEDGVARIRAARRAHRDHELTALPKDRRTEPRHQRRLLDDLDDARADLRRVRRQLTGAGTAVGAVVAGLGAEIWWLGASWPEDWTTRLIVGVTICFGVPSVEVLLSLLLGKRLGAAKTNLLTAGRRHRDSALFDAAPAPAKRAQLPLVARRGTVPAVIAGWLVFILTLLLSNYRVPDTSAGPDTATGPGAAAGPAVPTRLAAWESSLPVDWPGGVVVSPDGKRVYVANSGPHDRPDSTVSVMDFPSQKVLGTVRVQPHPEALALSPDGRNLVVTADGPTAAPAGSLTIVDTATLKVRATVALSSTAYDVVVSPDGKTAWCVLEGVSEYDPGQVVAVDLATAKVTGALPVGKDPAGIAMAPDGSRLYVASFHDRTVSVLDPVARKVVATVDTGAGPYLMALDPRRHTLWVTTNLESDIHHALTAIDTETLAAKPVDLGAPAPGVGAAAAIALTPDGEHLLVGRENPGDTRLPVLQVVDADTRRTISTITMPEPFRITSGPDSHHAFFTAGTLWVLDIP